jgi:hypothetical protein
MHKEDLSSRYCGWLFKFGFRVSIIALVALTASVKSQADEVSGCLQQRDSDLYFVPSTARGLLIPISSCSSAETCSSAQIFSRMSSGDCFEGQAFVANNQIQVTHVETVQLQALLGQWHGHGTDFYFETSSTLQLAVTSRTGQTNSGVYSYSVAPGTGDAWSLFISDQKTVQASHMVITAHGLQIQFLDQTTGELLTPIDLTR